VKAVKALLTAYISSRRRARRAEYAVAHLRHDAALLRRGPDTMRRREDRATAQYLDSLADLIEKAP
jgi:hypothetical protein